jgi:hypothetical protein
MASTVFDTLKFAKRMKDAGFNESQAEALSDAIREVQDSAIAELVTKKDLKELELRLENKFESMKGELSLLKWMIGFVLAGIVSLILKTFFV